MAKFSPSDLLSPMKKMEKSLDEINKNSAAIVEVVSGVGESVSGYLETIVGQLDVISTNLNTLVKTLSKNAVTSKLKEVVSKKEPKGDDKSAKAGVELFKAFGIGVHEFAKGMLLFSMVPKKTGERLSSTITDLLKALKEVTEDDIKNAKQLGEVGKALFVFTGFVILAGILAIPAAIFTPIIRFCIQGLVKTFELLAKHEEGIKKGADVLYDMGVALGLFSLAILAFGLTTRLLTWEGILTGAATVAIFGLLVIGLGAVSKLASKGADVLYDVAWGVAVFGIGLLAYGLAVKLLDMKQVLIGAGAILILTGICAVLGIPIVNMWVRAGALALQAIVKPILIFALGLIGIALALKLFDEKTINKIGPVFWEIGWSVAKIGLLAIAIIPGAIAMAAVGLALIALTIGLAVFKLVKWTEDDTKQLVEAITAVRIAFSPDGGGKKEGLFAKIGGVIGAALDSASIVMGAIAYMIAAVALIFVSFSLMVFKAVGWKEEDTKELVEAFTAVRVAFLGSDGKSEGIFAKIGGVIGGALDLVRMVEAAGQYTIAALAIVAVSGALAVFKLVGWKEEDTKELVEAFTAVRTALLGSDGKKEGIFAKIGGVIGGALDLARMVEAAAAFGAAAIALAALSGGLAAFKAVGWTDNDTEQLIAALGGVKKAFLGEEKKSSGGGGFFGRLLKKVGSLIEGGIDAGRMAVNAGALVTAGLALIAISTGLKKFKTVDWKDSDSEALMKAISSISAAFAQVAREGTVKKSFSGGGLFGMLLGGFSVEKNAVKEGIDSVKGAGKALKDISFGLEEFTKWYAKNAEALDLGNPNSLFFKGLKATVSSVGEAFAAVADLGTVKKSSFFGLFHYEENKAKEGIESVKGAGQALKDISEGVLKFTEWYAANQDKLDLRPNGLFFKALKTTVTTVGEAFAAVADVGTVEKSGGLFGLFHYEVNKSKEGVEAVKDAGRALIDISDGILKFTEWYAANHDKFDLKEGGLFFNALKTSITTVGDAFAAIGENRKDSLFWWNKNLTKEGIKAVDGVQTALRQIAIGLMWFTAWYKRNEDFLNTSNPNSGLLYSLKATIFTIGEAFAFIGGERIEGESGFLGLRKWNRNAVDEGIWAVLGVQRALRQITIGMIWFTEYYKRYEDFLNPDDPKSGLLVALRSTIFTLGEAFAFIGGERIEGESGKYGQYKWNRNAVDEGIWAVMGVQRALKKITIGMMWFTTFYKENEELLNTDDPNKGLLKALRDVVMSVGTTFAVIGGMRTQSSMSGVFGMFVWDDNMVEEGARVVRKAGRALMSIAYSLIVFTNFYKDNEEFLSIDNPNKGLFKALKVTLFSVGSMFMVLGGMKTKHTATLFGGEQLEWEESAIQAGVKSVQGVGQTIFTIANSIRTFMRMFNLNKNDFSMNDPNSGLLGALRATLFTVGSAFAYIGGKRVTRYDFDDGDNRVWEESAIQAGINSVKGVNTAIMGISEGVLKFGDFYRKNKAYLSSKSKDGLTQAFYDTVTAIGRGFITLGAMNEFYFDGKKWTWDENGIQKGVQSVQGVNTALGGIADGVLKFGDFYRKNRKYLAEDSKDGLFAAFIATVTTIGRGFMLLGTMNSFKYDGKEWTWNEDGIQKGVQSVQGVNTAISNISKSVLDFANFYNKNRKYLTSDKPGEGLLGALYSTIYVVGAVFATIGGANNGGVFSTFNWDTEKTLAGIGSVRGVNKALNEVTEGLVNFAKFYKSNETLLNTKDEKSGLISLLKSAIFGVGQAFGAVGGMKTPLLPGQGWDYDDHAVTAGIRAVKGCNKALEDVIEGVKNFIKSGIKEEHVKMIQGLLYGMSSGFSSMARVDLKKESIQFSAFATSFQRGFEQIYRQRDTYRRMHSVNMLLFTMERQVRLNTYDKTAEGIKKIADAVNTIDIEKGQAFADLFTAASKLRDNSKFYEDLMKAVEDIKKAIEAQNTGGGTGGGSNTQQTNNRPQSTGRPQGGGDSGGRGFNLNGKTISANNITINVSSEANVHGIPGYDS